MARRAKQEDDIDLRDAFALVALQGIIASGKYAAHTPREKAELAWFIADEAMALRNEPWANQKPK